MQRADGNSTLFGNSNTALNFSINPPGVWQWPKKHLKRKQSEVQRKHLGRFSPNYFCVFLSPSATQESSAASSFFQTDYFCFSTVRSFFSIRCWLVCSWFSICLFAFLPQILTDTKQLFRIEQNLFIKEDYDMAAQRSSWWEFLFWGRSLQAKLLTFLQRLLAWVFSRCSGFILQIKDMDVMLTD